MAQGYSRALDAGIRVGCSDQNRLPATVRGQGQTGGEERALGPDMDMIAFSRAGDRRREWIRSTFR
jgi:hypothetical protein